MRGKRFIALLAAAALGAGMSLPMAAEGASGRTVRLPYGYNDFLTIDEKGNVGGYYAEYFGALARTNGWEYEYVNVTWTEAVELLAAGEIDMLYPTNYSAEREKTMDFSALPTGYISSGIFALDSSSYAYEDFNAFDGARIAYVKGSSNENLTIEYAQQNGFAYTPVYETDNDSIMQALRDGEADLGVFNSAAVFPDGELVAIMQPQPAYLAVREGNAELLRSIDDGMQTILQSDPELVADTMKLTIMGSNASTLALSDEEQAFIRSGSSIRVGFYEACEPMAYVDEDGNYTGIYNAVLDEIRMRTGLHIQPCCLRKEQDWKEQLELGAIDFFIGVSDNAVPQDGRFRLTDPFMDYANVLVTRNDTAFAQIREPRIAMTSGRSEWEQILEQKLDCHIRVQYYNDVKSCLLAVSAREADAALIDNMAFNYQIKNDRLANLIRWPQYRFPTKVKLVALQDSDDVMFSTMNKVLCVADSHFVEAVSEEFLNVPYHSYTFADRLYNARVALIAIGLGLLIVLVVWLLIFIFRRKQRLLHASNLRREQRQLSITAALSSDYLAVYFIDLDNDRCEQLRISQDSADVVIDSDVHSQVLGDYVETRVQSGYRNDIHPFCDPQNVICMLEKEKSFSVRYQVLPELNHGLNYEMHFVDISPDAQTHQMVMGIRCVDKLVETEQEQRQILQDALESANLANAARAEFLEKLDIRSHMQALLDSTEEAKRLTRDPERMTRKLEQLSRCEEQVQKLIEDAIKTTKAGAHDHLSGGGSYDLRALLEKLIVEISPQIVEHEHHLRVDLDGIRHREVLGDPKRLRTIFNNLMNNAIQFTPDGGELSVTVRELRGEITGMGSFELTITDDGIGMSRKLLDRFFGTGHDETRKSDHGLGLSIVRNTIQMMNGTMTAKSELGRGTTITVTLPLRYHFGE